MSARPAPRLLLSAGEPSGDRLGGAVAAALRRRRPDLLLEGPGGSAMAAAGVSIRTPIDRLSAMGFLEVVSSVPRHLALLRGLGREARRGRYAGAILIDYPGFHLRLGAALRAAGVPVVQFVAPQLWAWRPGRLKLLARAADRVAAVLPFEEAWFAERGIPATYVGHPLTDRYWPSQGEARARLGLAPDEEVLGIFPGTRNRDVAAHWPLFRETAQQLLAEGSCRRIVVAAVPGMKYPEAAGDVILRLGTPEDVLAASSCILTKSGTTVLEAAWAGTPMVVAYRSRWTTYAIARRLMTVRWIGLANLILEAEVVPEFWRPPLRSADLAAAVRPLLRERSAEAEDQRRGFASVREALGRRNAADTVADLSLELFRV